MVRNAADVIGVNLLHHLHTGFDAIYIVDNGSQDGTDAVIERIAGEHPVKWSRDDGPFQQDVTLTELAQQALAGGADWIVPIDADEFWWCESGDLRTELARITADALECEVVQFIQRRDVTKRHPRSLLTMTRRVERPIGDRESARFMVESGQASFVEVCFPTKWIVRASKALSFGRGSHEVRGVARRESATGIQCLHAPLRARGVLPSRSEHGDRLNALDIDRGVGWQARHWSRLSREGKIDVEWAANTYVGNDTLDVYGTEHTVIVDERLARAAGPWVDHPLVMIGELDADVVASPPTNDAKTAMLREQLEVAWKRWERDRESIRDLTAAVDRISSSIAGRIYRASSRLPLLRRLIRKATGLGETDWKRRATSSESSEDA